MHDSSANSAPGPVQTALRESLAGISRTRKLLVGVSGGRDSMVLLAALLECGFRNLVVCHLNHTLRGRSSMADERFVRRVAARHGMAAEIARARTGDYAKAHAKSLELAARELRQAFFKDCAKRSGCRTLLLAHHADDQVETCLFNFLRGTGAAGLGGMKPVSTQGNLTVRRPLLAVTRQEIRDYQEKRRISFREDASNAETHHTRNKLRHRVIPAIEEAMGPSFRTAILRAAEILRAEDDWMTGLLPRPEAELPCKALLEIHPAGQARLVLAWLRSRGIPEPGWKETRRVLQLLDKTSGPAKVNLPGNWHARRRAGVLFLEKGGR